MHLLALVIELAAIVTPIVGILVELRRDVSDDGDDGILQPTSARLRRSPA